MGAIVTDARYRMGLAAIRSLGKAGVRVTAVDEDNHGKADILGFHSRYAARQAFITSAKRSPGQFLEDLMRLAAGHQVVIPVTLNSILTIAENISEVRKALSVVVAAPESIRTANDTSRLLPLAESLGVPVPLTTTLNGGESVEALADRVVFPAVLKFRAGEDLGLPPQQRYAIVHHKEEMKAVFSRMHALQAYPLVQEFIPGAGYGVSAIFDQHREPVAVFQHRRIREYPVSGGPSCFCESVVEPRMAEYALKLLKALDWAGIAMVEFKQDGAGEYRLMEINPRFWGSVPLAIAAGVDFPLVLYRLASGAQVKPSFHYRAGVRMRYLFQDLLSFPGYLERRPDKLQFLFNYLQDLVDLRVADGVFSLDDPRPGFVYTLRTVRRLLGGGRTGHGEEN